MQKVFQQQPFEWLDIIAPTEDELLAIANKYRLNDLSVKDCLEPGHLPKYEEIDDHIFVIARIFDSEVQHKGHSIQDISRKIAIFIGPDFLISIHRTAHGCLKNIYEKHKGKLENPYELLSIILMEVLYSYKTPAMDITNLIDSYESKLFLKDTKSLLLKDIYKLKRHAAVCARILLLSRVVVDKVGQNISKPAEWQDLRDMQLHVETLYSVAGESINNMLNIYLSLSQQKTNEVMRVLTVFSALFMPPTFIVGIYGMNFEYMPELHMPYAYYAVLGIIVIETLIIFLWFRRKHWIL